VDLFPIRLSGNRLPARKALLYEDHGTGDEIVVGHGRESHEIGENGHKPLFARGIPPVGKFIKVALHVFSTPVVVGGGKEVFEFSHHGKRPPGEGKAHGFSREKAIGWPKAKEGAVSPGSKGDSHDRGRVNASGFNKGDGAVRGFLEFLDARQFPETRKDKPQRTFFVAALDGVADFLQKKPGGFVGNGEEGAKPAGGNAPILTEETGGEKPGFEREVGAVEDGARGEGEVIAAVGAPPESPARDSGDVPMVASRAGDVIAPSEGDEKFFAFLVGHGEDGLVGKVGHIEPPCVFLSLYIENFLSKILFLIIKNKQIEKRIPMGG